MKCNLCGSKNNEIIFDYTRFEKQNVLKCSDCGLVFLENITGKEESKQFYQDEYRKVESLPKQTAEELFNDPVIRKDCINRAEWILDKYGSLKGKRVLEIGSSSGYFLQMLSKAGAGEAVGVELNEAYANYARDLGFPIYTKPLEEIGFKNEFDLAVSFHTLEHVSDPMAVFNAVKASLKGRNALFMGEVPNQNDWRIRIFDNYIVKRLHYDPYHNYYFSPETITKYVQKAGFADIKLETIERYNSLIQLKRILSGEYDHNQVEYLLKRDVFAKPKDDVRIRQSGKQEIEFNRIFAAGVNSELMGNCLRWIAARGK